MVGFTCAVHYSTLTSMSVYLLVYTLSAHRQGFMLIYYERHYSPMGINDLDKIFLGWANFPGETGKQEFGGNVDKLYIGRNGVIGGTYYMGIAHCP